MSKSKATIDIIRHGEPEGGRMYRGSGTDHPLSATGWQQMHNKIGQMFLTEDTGWDLIISSPMRRCLDFAQTLAKQLHIPLITEPELTEIYFGDWEGKTAAEIAAEDAPLFKAYQNDPLHHRPANAEPLEAFESRTNNAITGLFDTHPEKNMLLVSHGGVMRTALNKVLSGSIQKRQCIRFPYAAMMRLYMQHGQMRAELL